MGKKAYHLHERAYRQMAEAGIRTWDERKGLPPIDPGVSRFLDDALAQPWVPRRGRALELGCGTAPILRSIARRGFSGVGVDISRTAVELARAQAGRKLEFHVGDVTRLSFLADASFDLVVDGHCLHCLVDDADRVAFHREVARVLRPGGCFLLMSMARPIDRRALARSAAGHVVGEVLYQPIPGAGTHHGARRFEGRAHAPTRRFVAWRTMLGTLVRFGLSPRLVRLVHARPDEAVSDLSVASVRV